MQGDRREGGIPGAWAVGNSERRGCTPMSPHSDPAGAAALLAVDVPSVCDGCLSQCFYYTHMCEQLCGRRRENSRRPRWCSVYSIIELL